MSDVDAVRRAIREALPFSPSNDGEAPDPRRVYVPPAHAKALRLESGLVIGSRGVGKSFWTAALGSPELRSILGSSARELEPELERAQVRVGFGLAPRLDAYPNAEVFAELLVRDHEPYHIWRGVVLRWLAETLGESIPRGDWRETVEWSEAEPEASERLIERAQGAFEARAERGLVLFDALDRTSRDWNDMDRIARGLLRFVLRLRSYPSIRAKVFLREDQLARTVTDFPDASKLLATKTELSWQPHDLHGLLWQLFCNAPEPHGSLLRGIYGRVVGEEPPQRGEIRSLHPEVKREGEKQRRLFEELAGAWMGRDRRRGVPYVWSVSHLADGKGRTSPRSFQAAIRAAAEDSLEKYPDHPCPLHYESIKRGVLKASEIRIAEVTEDYPWVSRLLEPLRGLTVPCPFPAVEERWKERFPEGLGSEPSDRLPPQHLEREWSGIREDLERLGLFEGLQDGRVNMPDLYRVGFGLGRKGGVRPAA